jgi:kynurenine formamidase
MRGTGTAEHAHRWTRAVEEATVIDARMTVTAADLPALMQSISNWGRWEADDQHGTLNYITPEKRLRAASLIKDGVTVSAAMALPTLRGPENYFPVQHMMLHAGDIPGTTGTGDFMGIACHGFAVTHIDALCHFLWDGKMYNGFPAGNVRSNGAITCGLDGGDGICSRGVLLDIPLARGRDWLDPGDPIFVDDLEAAEARQGVRVEEGDILLVRTGRRRRPASAGLPANPMEGMAGLYASTLPWLHERRVAVLGSDGVSDVLPSGMGEGSTGPGATGLLRQPVHTGAIVYMGLHLIDNANLEDLADACAQRNRWEFMFTIAPLKLTTATGSAINPIALF